MGKSYEDCLTNVQKTLSILKQLGFLVNERKSVLVPSQICRFLGFIFNSKSMTLSLPPDKQMRTKVLLLSFPLKSRCKIRDFARLIGILCSICPATKYGWVYVKRLEHAKFLALKRSNGNFNSSMTISKEVNEDLHWWKNNITNTFRPIRSFQFQKTIFTDASPSGWGAFCNKQRANGPWSVLESQLHINSLELIAVLFGLKCFAKEESDCDILLRVDNTCAISYINKKGGVKFPMLNNICRQIWQFCESRNILIYASYIKSAENKEADEESRKSASETEWSLSSEAFQKIVKVFGPPELDLCLKD